MADANAQTIHRLPRLPALPLALGSIALLLALRALLHPQPVVDELRHLGVIERFCQGNWSWPTLIPMPPGYHLIAWVPAKLFGCTATVLRLLNALLAGLAIVVFHRTIRHWRPAHPDDALLRFAWNPLLFPYTVLVYTDGPAILCLVVGVYLHVRQRFALSAVALLFAVLIRQSNLVWVAFMGVWAVVDRCYPDRAGTGFPSVVRGAGSVRAAIQRVWPHLALLALAAGFLLWKGSLIFGAQRTNRPQFNVAVFYHFALVVILLWAPIWLADLRAEWRSVYAPLVRRPLVCAAAVVVVAALVLAFRNPHPWNQVIENVNDWPLIGMALFPALRVPLAIGIVVVTPLIVRFVRRQPQRRMLAATWLFSFLFLLPHPMAEERYYIVPAFFLNFFASYSEAGARRLTYWYGGIVAAFVLLSLVRTDPGGMVW